MIKPNVTPTLCLHAKKVPLSNVSQDNPTMTKAIVAPAGAQAFGARLEVLSDVQGQPAMRPGGSDR